MDFSKEKWVVANGHQVWRDGETTATSARICAVQNAAAPVEQLSVDTQAKIARFIAAGPDLLRALKQAFAWADDPECDSAMPITQAKVAKAARAAIAKAEGRL